MCGGAGAKVLVVRVLYIVVTYSFWCMECQKQCVVCFVLNVTLIFAA